MMRHFLTVLIAKIPPNRKIPRPAPSPQTKVPRSSSTSQPAPIPSFASSHPPHPPTVTLASFPHRVDARRSTLASFPRRSTLDAPIPDAPDSAVFPLRQGRGMDTGGPEAVDVARGGVGGEDPNRRAPGVTPRPRRVDLDLKLPGEIPRDRQFVAGITIRMRSWSRPRCGLVGF